MCVCNCAQLQYTVLIIFCFKSSRQLRKFRTTDWSWLLVGRWLKGQGSGSWWMNEWRQLSNRWRYGAVFCCTDLQQFWSSWKLVACCCVVLFCLIRNAVFSFLMSLFSELNMCVLSLTLNYWACDIAVSALMLFIRQSVWPVKYLGAAYRRAVSESSYPLAWAVDGCSTISSCHSVTTFEIFPRLWSTAGHESDSCKQCYSKCPVFYPCLFM